MKILSILVTLLIVLCTSSVLAYEPDTHEYFTEKALEAAGLKRGEYIQYKEEIIGGSRYEDEESHGLRDFRDWDTLLYKPCPVVNHPFCNHFLNPYTHKGLKSWATGWQQYPSAYERAEILWKFAQWSYARGNKENAYFNLGRVAHLLQDMAVPEHTHSQEHISSSMYPYETYADYNKYLYNVGMIKNYQNLKDMFYSLAKISYKAGIVRGNTKDKDKRLKANAELLMPKAMGYTANLFKYWEKQKNKVYVGRGDENFKKVDIDINNNREVVKSHSNKRSKKCRGNYLQTLDYKGRFISQIFCQNGCDSVNKVCKSANSKSRYKECSGKWLNTIDSQRNLLEQEYCSYGCNKMTNKCKPKKVRRYWWQFW